MMKNMMKAATVGLALVPAALSADQVMIAGWEFSQFTTGAFNSIGDTLGTGGDFSQAGKLKSNYSGLLAGSAAGGPLAEDFGTLYYDGTNGSTSAGNLDITGGDKIFPFAQNLSSLSNQIDPPYGSAASNNVLINNGQTIYNNFGLRIDEDNNLVIEARAGFAATSWTLNIAHQTVGGTAGGQSLGFFYKEPGGSNFIQFGTASVSSTDAAFTQSIPQLDGEQTVQIQIRVTGSSATNAVILDNVGVFAEEQQVAVAVPEIRTSRSGSNLIARFDTVAGVDYTVRSSTDLSTDPATWAPVTTVTGDGSEAAVPVAIPASAPRRVFVVVEVP